MTFEAYEESAELASPVWLYQFFVNGTYYRYTSHAEDVTLDAQPYARTVMSHSDIDDSSELGQNNLTITVPRDFPIALMFRISPPSDVILLTIFKFHLRDPDQQTAVQWSGRALNCAAKGVSKELYCESVYTSMRRPGLRRPYSRGCPHVLYGIECRAEETDFQIVTQLTLVDGLTVESGDFAGLADGRLAGGLLYWEAEPGRIEKRGIDAHVGETIILTDQIPELAAGQEVTVSPGCAHDPTDCQSFFDNYDNYGGWPDLPEKNPFGQNSVF